MSSLYSIQQQFLCVFRKSFPLLLVCLLAILLVAPQPSQARTNRKAEKQRIEKGIQKFRINISKLEDGIAAQQVQIESSQEKQRNLLDELTMIDSRLLAQLRRLRDFEEQVEEQSHLISLKEVELQQLNSDKGNVQAHLQTRIKAYYKMGEIGIANVAFTTESMPRMLKFRDSFATLIDYDKSLLNAYRDSITVLQQAKTTLNLEKGVLNDFIAIVQDEQAASSAIKHEKETLLNQIQTQKELHEQAIGEMNKVADNLSASLNALKRKNALFDKGFLLDKGQHPAPIHGEVIAKFGEERKNKLGVSGKTTGITIATTGVNEVRAIFEGEVRYASYLYGYGNTIIIDHGFEYFTIIARLEKLLVQEGDKVQQGDTIGLTGDTAMLMEDGIYLEIRHASTPLDPLLWLDNNDLTLP